MTNETLEKLAEQAAVFGGASKEGLAELFKIVRAETARRAAELIAKAHGEALLQQARYLATAKANRQRGDIHTARHFELLESSSAEVAKKLGEAYSSVLAEFRLTDTGASDV